MDALIGDLLGGEEWLVVAALAGLQKRVVERHKAVQGALAMLAYVPQKGRGEEIGRQARLFLKRKHADWLRVVAMSVQGGYDWAQWDAALEAYLPHREELEPLFCEYGEWINAYYAFARAVYARSRERGELAALALSCIDALLEHLPGNYAVGLLRFMLIDSRISRGEWLDKASEQVRFARWAADTQGADKKAMFYVQLGDLHRVHLYDMAQAEGYYRLAWEAKADDAGSGYRYSAYAANSIASLLLRKGEREYAQAGEWVERALELKPDAAHFVDTKARLLLYRGEVAQARALWQRVLELDAQHLSARVYLLRLAVEAGEEEAARVYLDWLLEQKEDDFKYDKDEAASALADWLERWEAGDEARARAVRKLIAALV